MSRKNRSTLKAIEHTVTRGKQPMPKVREPIPLDRFQQLAVDSIVQRQTALNADNAIVVETIAKAHGLNPAEHGVLYFINPTHIEFRLVAAAPSAETPDAKLNGHSNDSAVDLSTVSEAETAPAQT